MYAVIFSQGKFVHKDSVAFPMEERGLQFGDGVYEVIRIYNGTLYLLDEHIKRLYQSLNAIRIKIAYTADQFKHILKTLVERNQMTTNGFIYLQITRGSASRIHTFPENISPNMYAYIKDRPRPFELLKSGIHVITHPDERWDNCYIKSLNLLPNILARQIAIEQDAYEAVLHRNEKVTECSSGNIFIIREGAIYTHPTTKAILAGCVRGAVKRFAKNLQIPFIENAFTLSDFYKADEVFLTSSLSEILPVITVDHKQVGGGQAGEITRKLQQAYEVDAQIARD